MREAELKHGRLAMLAFLGWVAVDAGLRIPGRGWESIPNSFVAHDAAVANGSMGYVGCSQTCVAYVMILGYHLVTILKDVHENISEVTSLSLSFLPFLSSYSTSFMLLVVGILELISGAAIFDQAKGSGRASGDFSFDPLNLGLEKKNKDKYAVSEIKNGRLAMLAISGILTAQAVFPAQTFPFL